MLDAHTHLNSDQLYPSRKKHFRNFCASWWTWLVNIWVNHEWNKKNLLIQKHRKKYLSQESWKISCSIWLHPCETVFGNITSIDVLQKEMEIFEQLAKENRQHIVAIWECGIDAHHKRSNQIRDLQIELLHRQCVLARKLDLPVVIHSRSQRDITYDILSQYSDLKINLHCRWYTTQEIKKAMDTFPFLRVGFCGNLTYPKAIDIQDSCTYYIQAWGQYLLETDAPYLSPQAVRGIWNVPAHIGYTYDYLSILLDIPKGNIIQDIKTYWEELFGI